MTLNDSSLIQLRRTNTASAQGPEPDVSLVEPVC
jgi:hypothetical protein